MSKEEIKITDGAIPEDEPGFRKVLDSDGNELGFSLRLAVRSAGAVIKVPYGHFDENSQFVIDGLHEHQMPIPPKPKG